MIRQYQSNRIETELRTETCGKVNSSRTSIQILDKHAKNFNMREGSLKPKLCNPVIKKKIVTLKQNEPRHVTMKFRYNVRSQQALNPSDQKQRSCRMNRNMHNAQYQCLDGSHRRSQILKHSGL